MGTEEHLESKEGKTKKQYYKVTSDTLSSLDSAEKRAKETAPTVIEDFKRDILESRLKKGDKEEYLRYLDTEVMSRMTSEPKVGYFMLNAKMGTFALETRKIKRDTETKKGAFKVK